MYYLVLPAAMGMAGFGRYLEKWLEWMAGARTETVILVKEPRTLHPPGLTLTSDKRMRVIGDMSGACLVLVSPMPDVPTKQMERRFARAIHNVKVGVTLVTAKGEKHRVYNGGPSWNLYGRVEDQSEMSACFFPASGHPIAKGTKIQKINVKVSGALAVKAIYWESTNVFDSVTHEGDRTN